MKGTILDYSVENDLGYISGDDGKGYTFSSNNWRDTKSHPKKNLRVDFDIQQNKATEKFPLPKSNPNSATSNVYDNFTELKHKIVAEVKNNQTNKC